MMCVCKDVDRFRNESVHSLCLLKACQISKVREITNVPLQNFMAPHYYVILGLLKFCDVVELYM